VRWDHRQPFYLSLILLLISPQVGSLACAHLPDNNDASNERAPSASTHIAHAIFYFHQHLSQAILQQSCVGNCDCMLLPAKDNENVRMQHSTVQNVEAHCTPVAITLPSNVHAHVCKCTHALTCTELWLCDVSTGPDWLRCGVRVSTSLCT